MRTLLSWSAPTIHRGRARHPPMARPIDRTRFEALVEAHHAAVYRSAHRVVRAAAAAQDVAQEVVLRVLDGRLDVAALAADEARPVLCHWAVRIAWNTRRGEARRAAREERHAMERRDESPAPRDDDDQRLWQLVDGLADELRVPLLLRFVEGVTFAKIGEWTSVTCRTCTKRAERVVEWYAELRDRHQGVIDRFVIEILRKYRWRSTDTVVLEIPDVYEDAEAQLHHAADVAT